MNTITEQLENGIENLNNDFYEQINLNSQDIIENRIYELDLYFDELKNNEYELYLIEENLSEFYNFIDTPYPR